MQFPCSVDSEEDISKSNFKWLNTKMSEYKLVKGVKDHLCSSPVLLTFVLYWKVNTIAEKKQLI